MIKKICCFRLSSFALVWGWLGAVFHGLLAFLGFITLAHSKELAGASEKTLYGESVIWLYQMIHVLKIDSLSNDFWSSHIRNAGIDGHIHWPYYRSFEGEFITSFL